MSKAEVKNWPLYLKLGVEATVLLFLVVILSCSPKQERAVDHTELVPKQWTPSLEQVQADLEQNYAANSNKSQHALNRASQNMADLRDVQLFITYVLLMQVLNESARKDLFNEQTLWLAKREESARAAVVSKGGSLEPLEYAGAFRRVTEERLTELQSRLAKQRAKN